ncbi:hypothetical protein CMV_028085 [Castanea mollissima]|uniref:Uncharacterized protein n=1 Tax=Castanea mollissima TaxID=60419 RepID=A0A8J4V266_9ROSI|nr:hypothetical protein CMV_028085 [Castanea mollissima]
MCKCLSWKYFSLPLSLLFFHSQFPFSSSLSSNSQCSALLHFNRSLSLNEYASPPFLGHDNIINNQMCENSYPKTSTLFLLRHLKTLNLARNDFDFSLISPEFGKFQSLTHLNLSRSRFSGEIPYEISQLSSLVSLDLSYNVNPHSYLRSPLTLSIKTPVWKRVIGNLTQLRVLLLDFTEMSSITPNSLMNLSSSLTTLSLHECNLQGTFEMNIFRLPCIQTLNLGYNSNLGGAIPTSLGNLTKMIYLDLSYNNFNGLLPSSIFDLPNLSVLDLRHNQLVGPLPNHVSGLNLLIDLSLRSNFLNGTLPSWLFSLTSLVTLTLDHNQFIGEIGEFKYNNSLDYLDLSYNMLQGSIPSSISRLVNLTYLSLSSNNLQGSVPSSISRLVNLTTLYLSSNNLSIMLDLEFLSNLNNLNALSFSYNNLLVSINNNLTFTLPNLEELYLSSCNISEFPIFLKVATNLGYLDLSNNKIHGQTPKWLGAVGRNSLYFLDLSHNFLTSIDKIQGPFPTLNSLNLQYLFASNNNLTGEIPSLICNASYLDVIDLSHNNFSGTIPKCLVHSNVLSVLDLRKNSLNVTLIFFIFHVSQRHRTPFIAKLVGFVAFEIIVSALLSIKCPVTCKVDVFDVSENINNLCALE